MKLHVSVKPKWDIQISIKLKNPQINNRFWIFRQKQPLPKFAKLQPALPMSLCRYQDPKNPKPKTQIGNTRHFSWLHFWVASVSLEALYIETIEFRENQYVRVITLSIPGTFFRNIWNKMNLVQALFCPTEFKLACCQRVTQMSRRIWDPFICKCLPQPVCEILHRSHLWSPGDLWQGRQRQIWVLLLPPSFLDIFFWRATNLAPPTRSKPKKVITVNWVVNFRKSQCRP